MSNGDLDMPIVDKASGFNARPYEGKRVKIARVERIWAQNVFPDGKTYTPESKEMMWKVQIETEPIKELDDKGEFIDKVIEIVNDKKEKKNITVTTEFNLQSETNDAGDIVMGKYHNDITNQDEERPNPVISRHPKAALWAFMRKIGVEKLADLKDKIVTLTTVPSKKENDDRVFLRIVQ